MKRERVAAARQAAGAAVLQEGLTTALMRSALIELARHGYAGLSLGAVARRAKVGKPALYRRWRGKEDLIADLLVQIGMPIVAVEDMGSLERELEEYARRSVALLGRPLARALLPELYGEMTRDTRLAELIRTRLQTPKREKAMEILDRAVARGEIARSFDRSLALDLMAGPLYWRLVVTKEEVGEDFAATLARMMAGALRSL